MNSFQKVLRLTLFISCIFILLFQGNADAQGVWTTDSTFPLLPHSNFTAPAVNGKIYVIGGGLGRSVYIDSLQIFDPIANAWSTPADGSTIAPMGYENVGSSATSVVGGKIYLIGGTEWDKYPNSNFTDTIYVYDPSTNTWSTPATSGWFIARESHTASVVNGKIYVIGGDSSFENLQSTYIDAGSLQVFDPSSNTWSTPGTIGALIPRSGHTAAVVNGKIYIIGGAAVSSNSVSRPPRRYSIPQPIHGALLARLVLSTDHILRRTLSVTKYMFSVVLMVAQQGD